MEMRTICRLALFIALVSYTASTPQQPDPRYRPDTDVDMPLSRVYYRQMTTPRMPPWHDFDLPPIPGREYPLGYSDYAESGDDYDLSEHFLGHLDEHEDVTTEDFWITESAQKEGTAKTGDHKHESNHMHSSASYTAHCTCILVLPFSMFINWFLKSSYY